MDCKNTPEGRTVQMKYSDLLPLSRPEPIKPRMTAQNRAKIFSPFAALRGYEDEIASEGKDYLKGKRIELSEEQEEILGNKIGQLRKNQSVKIKYFTDGYYEELPGRVDSVDAINKELKIYTGVTNAIGKELPTIIPFEDILEVNMN